MLYQFSQKKMHRTQKQHWLQVKDRQSVGQRTAFSLKAGSAIWLKTSNLIVKTRFSAVLKDTMAFILFFKS